ncbi:MAG: T9SS type A sorting domain-containing protein [Bacteroidetes bacterium]|nr:T9SS type A sorting domain-containing protein [Bacteroidota bacterium]MBL7104786.1 T9SS type A sorting domain-containing protein [Bacteroidales bacterium]
MMNKLITIKNFVALLIMGIIFLVNSKAIAQTESDEPGSTSNKVPLLEVAEGEYIYEPRDNFETSPAYSYSSPWFTTVQVNVNELGQNIVGDAANEPSIAFDPTDPNKMAIGWRQFDNINNSFRQAGFGYTTDAGQTWTFPGVIDPGVFRSDPVLDCDTEGNFYYNSLTVQGEDYLCDVYISADGGNSWDDGTFAYGGDKQWMSIDKSGGLGSGNIYAFWTSYYSICDPDFFTRSVDAGFSYEDCSSIPGYPYWGTTTVSAEGELYVCGAQWGGNFMVAKSSNAQNPGQTVTWDFSTTVDLDGEVVGFGGYNCPNPTGLLGQTIIAIDSSGGPSHGNVYILCSVERYSTPDPLDVMFAKSTDGGLTWSSPIRVNDDPGNNAWQWFGTMSVAPDGRIDVVWLDTRDYPGTVLTSLYYAYSLDAGDTWSENIPLSDFFDPHLGWPQQDKMGDYFDMYSNETGAHLAWANTFNGEQDVYYGHITPQFTGTDELKNKTSISLSQNFPNPFKDQTSIRYYLAEQSFVSLSVFDITGREVAILINEIQNAGNYQATFSATRLESGVYYYQLQAGDDIVTRKLMILK